MKKKYLFFIIIIFLTTNCKGQVSPELKEQFKYIIRLIKEDKARELSALIDYPLGRENPLPDIKSSADFISHFKIIFDYSFKQQLSRYNDSDIFERNGVYGLVGGSFSGEIWINDNGKIIAINYSSPEEQRLKEKLTEEIKLKIHPSVKNWRKNILVWKSDKLLIRIDDTDKGLRYVCWGQGHNMSEKPDLILYNGLEEQRGTMGGWTWTFRNGNWSYLIDDVEMCEGPEDCGLFLRILYGGTEKSKIRMKEVK